MFTNTQLPFLKEKIYDLRTAVFYNESNAVLKIPNNIISVLHVDDVGQIWFFMRPPGQYISEFEHTFYAHLNLLKKGRDYFLKVEGKAHLVTDPEEINDITDLPEEVKESARTQLLVKMKVSNIHYYEMQKRQTNHALNKLTSYFTRLLPKNRPLYRLYRLETEPGF